MFGIFASLMVVIMPFSMSWAAELTPVKALFVVGGGFHNYKKLTPLLVEGLPRYANVTLEPFWINKPEEVEKFAEPDFGKGYDVIVYDICYADLPATAGVKAAIKIIEDGKPALMVHCAMHCFWKDETWASCCGLLTRNHEKYHAFDVSTAPIAHPIAKALPVKWTTPGDELYRNVKFPFPETAVPMPILMGHSEQTQNDYVVAWAHVVGAGRVFGTTLGHDLKTVTMPEYQQLLANGILWSVGKLGDDGKPIAGYVGSMVK